MTSVKILRSVLYVPGDNERAIKKAPGLSVDAIIYDLEDAVATHNKTAARECVCKAVARRESTRCIIAIRINDHSSDEGADDLQAALAAGPDALVLPKVRGPQDIEALHARIETSSGLGSTVKPEIWAMMEHPMAILNAQSIAKLANTSAPRLTALVMGTNDLDKQTGVSLDEMTPWLMHCVLVAKAYGLPIIDGVYNNYSDQQGFVAACEQGRDRGFNGKTLIHPSQITCANQVFAPSEEQLREAREVVALFERHEHEKVNVLELNGTMVERLHYEMALKLLEMAKVIEELER